MKAVDKEMESGKRKPMNIDKIMKRYKKNAPKKESLCANEVRQNSTFDDVVFLASSSYSGRSPALTEK